MVVTCIKYQSLIMLISIYYYFIEELYCTNNAICYNVDRKAYQKYCFCCFMNSLRKLRQPLIKYIVV